MIRVFIPSRARPTQLAASIWSLWITATDQGRIGIGFDVAYDMDDIATCSLCAKLEQQGIPVVAHCGPRPKSPCASHNAIAKLLHEDDTVVIWSDRIVCVTPGWDYMVNEHVRKAPTRITWWLDKSTKRTSSHQWVLPPLYRAAIGNELCPNIFPFWFDDMWHREIDWFMSQDKSMELEAGAAGIHRITTRGRDFHFWTEVFIATRLRRLEIAQTATAHLGVRWKPPSPAMVAHYEKNDRWQLENAAHLEATYGDKSDPGPEYREAYLHAQTLLPQVTA